MLGEKKGVRWGPEAKLVVIFDLLRILKILAVF